MMFLGFLLIAAAIAVAVGVVLNTSESANLAVFGNAVPGVNEPWEVFFTGAAVALVLSSGMFLVVIGASRRLRDRRDLRELREDHEESLSALVADKRRLERELAAARQGSQPGPGGPPGRPRPGGPPGPSGNTGPLPRAEPAPQRQGARVPGGRRDNPGGSPFFTRKG